MDNAKIISHLLKAVNFKEVLVVLSHFTVYFYRPLYFHQNAIFCCTSNGIKVTTEDMKSIQLNTFIETQVFQVKTFTKAWAARTWRRHIFVDEM